MADPTSAQVTPRHRMVPHTLLAAIVAFAIPWIYGAAPDFLYDAAQYWGGAAAIVAGDSPTVPGGLATRGIFTAFVYLAPALASAVFGASAAVWTVLVWNAVFGAVVSAVLVPRVAGLFTGRALSPPPPLRIWVSAIVGGVILAGFARFPLVDVWSTALALAGFYGLAAARRWWSLSLAGLAVVVATNLRPSLIAPLLLATVIVLLVRPRVILLAAPAALIALIPQVVVNIRAWGLVSLAPPETGPLVMVQARWAAFALRYDTVAFADQPPQQWFCDPRYAALLIGEETPENQLGVIASAFRHFPESVWFLLRKVAANLHWSSMTPYENPPSDVTHPMTILVLFVSAFGLVALVVHAIRAGSDRRRRFITLAMLGFWFGALGTLLVSTPETRFALPLVLVGLVGIVSAVPERVRLSRPSVTTTVAVVCAVVLAVGLFAAGKEALGHNLPPGPLPDALACSVQ